MKIETLVTCPKCGKKVGFYRELEEMRCNPHNKTCRNCFQSHSECEGSYQVCVEERWRAAT